MSGRQKAVTLDCGIRTGIGYRHYEVELSEFRNILAAILKFCIETECSRMLSWRLGRWCGFVRTSATFVNVILCVCVCMYVCT